MANSHPFVRPCRAVTIRVEPWSMCLGLAQRAVRTVALAQWQVWPASLVIEVPPLTASASPGSYATERNEWPADMNAQSQSTTVDLDAQGTGAGRKCEAWWRLCRM